MNSGPLGNWPNPIQAGSSPFIPTGVEFEAGPWAGHPDICAYTIKAPPGQQSPLSEAAPRGSTKGSRRGMDFAGELLLRDEPGLHRVSGRGLVCSCYDGRYFSATVRVDKGQSTSLINLPNAPLTKPEWILGYQPSSTPTPSHLVTEQQLSDLLYAITLEGVPDPTGLILVAGSTGSGKSTVARGLIHRRLETLRAAFLSQADGGRVRPDLRRPHLLTVEDPIERYWFASSSKEPIPPWETQAYGIDYTPRSIPGDTHDLRSALHSALRQTPSVVYVGEVRERDDWHELLEFAGTGHLVVATTHAGSLVEAISRLLIAVKAKSPADRGAIAERLLAVIHLRHLALSIPDADLASRTMSMLLPAVWRRQPLSVSALVASGIGSVLPMAPPPLGSTTQGHDWKRAISLGRTWFGRQLLFDIERWTNEALNPDAAQPQQVQLLLQRRRDLVGRHRALLHHLVSRKATALDLLGM